jgi:glycosyltransferase involved in cell wall biosynthesis
VADRAREHDAELAFVSIPDTALPRGMASAGRALQQAAASADVIVIDSIVATHLAPWLARTRPRVPLAAIAHQPAGGIDGNRLSRALRRRLDLLTYRRTALIVAASPTIAAAMAADGVPSERLVVVPPGRDGAGATGGGSRDLRAGRAASILCVGAWQRRKGIVPLLDAFATLPADLATLHLVGPTGVERRYEAAVRARLADPIVGDRVVVWGPLPGSEVAGLYRSADLFALPSTREPYGTVYGEAMAAGLPVVGWDAGNLPHLSAEGEGCLMAPVGDVGRLAAALERLAGDPKLRAAMGARAQQLAAALPTWDETSAQLFATLRGLAVRPGH